MPRATSTITLCHLCGEPYKRFYQHWKSLHLRTDYEEGKLEREAAINKAMKNVVQQRADIVQRLQRKGIRDVGMVLEFLKEDGYHLYSDGTDTVPEPEAASPLTVPLAPRAPLAASVPVPVPVGASHLTVPLAHQVPLAASALVASLHPLPESLPMAAIGPAPMADVAPSVITSAADAAASAIQHHWLQHHPIIASRWLWRYTQHQPNLNCKL